MQTVKKLPLIWCFSTLFMVGLVGCCVVEEIVDVHMAKGYGIYLALSAYGMKTIQLWQLFTYQFIHVAWSEFLYEGWIHLFVNLVGFVVIGRAVERAVGGKRFLLVYWSAVVAGGVVQGIPALTGYLIPESMESASGFFLKYFGGPFAGATVGLFGLFGLWCFYGAKGCSSLSRMIQGPVLFWMVFGLIMAAQVFWSYPYLPHLAHMTAMLTGAWFGRVFKRSFAEDCLPPVTS